MGFKENKVIQFSFVEYLGERVQLEEVVEIRIISIIKSPVLILLWVPSCLTKFKAPTTSKAPVSGSLPRGPEPLGDRSRTSTIQKVSGRWDICGMRREHAGLSVLKTSGALFHSSVLSCWVFLFHLSLFLENIG